MSTIKLIHMYASPWAERVLWALTFKGVPYEKQNYQPGVDEEAVKKLTGQAQVPVLLVNGTVIPDSTAILNWLEEYKSQPALMPGSEKDCAQVTLWEELMNWGLGPKHGCLSLGTFCGRASRNCNKGAATLRKSTNTHRMLKNMPRSRLSVS
jgi:glutathione S-transferase